MPRPRPRHLAPLALAACGALLAGCGVPPELLEPSPSAPVRPSPATPTPAGSTGAGPSVPPLPAPTRTPAFNEHTAVDCRGRPTGAQVISVLRRAGILSAGVTAAVRAGPLCAGEWQYTELRIPQREPLLVVTRGAPTALTLVAAGTNVCAVWVRANAPAGIRAAACDAPPSTPATGANPSTSAPGT